MTEGYGAGQLETIISKAITRGLMTALRRELNAIMRYTGFQVDVKLECTVPKDQLQTMTDYIIDNGFGNSVYLVDFRENPDENYIFDMN